MSAEHTQLINTFYTAFQNMDAETMASCYHPDIEFYDPAFGDLKGEEAANMWRMLLGRSKGLNLTFRDVSADEQTGKAFWEAKYEFGKTGRKVHNKIQANFEFKDGKIIKHRDTFDIWAWSRQALGLTGILLGWSPLVKNKIRSQARGGLKKFTEEKMKE